MSKTVFPIPEDYDAFLSELKERIRSAQLRASLAVNQELILLYWQIGQDILTRQKQQGWGTRVIERLARDLKKEFPNLTGLSPRNLGYMKSFADAYPDSEILQRSVAKLPWRHNIALLEKLKSPEQRLWYARQALEHGWSRDILVMQIETNLYQRQGGAVTNFERTLPQPESDLARQMLKDPYCLEFLTISQDAKERELEQALVLHIRDFLLELGVGFAFLGNQYPIVVDEREYRMDLLFYHTRLHCYVVIDLKMREFEPSFSGQMSFYVSAVDNLLKTPRDERTIGIILCRSKRQTTVEYALQDIYKPIGVSTYRLRQDLPEPLQDSLPTIEQLEIELESAIAQIKPEQQEE